MEKDECSKDKNLCPDFIGDIFNMEHISNCYKNCSCCETEDLIQNDEPLKSV